MQDTLVNTISLKHMQRASSQASRRYWNVDISQHALPISWNPLLDIAARARDPPMSNVNTNLLQSQKLTAHTWSHSPSNDRIKNFHHTKSSTHRAPIMELTEYISIFFVPSQRTSHAPPLNIAKEAATAIKSRKYLTHVSCSGVSKTLHSPVCRPRALRPFVVE